MATDFPDGAEDRNRNGKLDAGETSATNVDTDSDGIWDGADAMPVPAIDATVITAVYPDSGPAHGGQSVVIEGRNFSANQRVWFADRIAAQVQSIDTDTISVTVPPMPYPLPEPNVSVRVEDVATQNANPLCPTPSRIRNPRS
jgi:hypothetical protein